MNRKIYYTYYPFMGDPVQGPPILREVVIVEYNGGRFCKVRENTLSSETQDVLVTELLTSFNGPVISQEELDKYLTKK